MVIPSLDKLSQTFITENPELYKTTDLGKI